MSSLPRNPTIVSVSSPSLKSSNVGIPRTAYRSRIVGFSSPFNFATVARPSNSVASASTVGASRRHGPHHSAQKSTSTTPLFFSSSKLLSVNVLTFSDAILVSYLYPQAPARAGHYALRARRRQRIALVTRPTNNPGASHPSGRAATAAGCQTRRVRGESPPTAPLACTPQIEIRYLCTFPGP